MSYSRPLVLSDKSGSQRLTEHYKLKPDLVLSAVTSQALSILPFSKKARDFCRFNIATDISNRFIEYESYTIDLFKISVG